jgi:UDP-2-acetamido-3-amino-2,3-dideoxy-glucuronate N-acetyltransferase
VPPAYVHPSAIIDDGAVIGDDTKIWHFCHVSAGARIGRGCVLGQNVFVAATVTIGDGVHIQNNVSLYDGVILADHVFVGPSAVFTNVTRPRVEHPRKDAYEETRIARGVTIGANATIVCGVKLGEYAFVGAGAVVTHDIPAYALVAGNPATQRGWACRCGERLPEGSETTYCTNCEAAYVLRDGGLVRV